MKFIECRSRRNFRWPANLGTRILTTFLRFKIVFGGYFLHFFPAVWMQFFFFRYDVQFTTLLFRWSKTSFDAGLPTWISTSYSRSSPNQKAMLPWFPLVSSKVSRPLTEIQNRQCIFHSIEWLTGKISYCSFELELLFSFRVDIGRLPGNQN